MSDDEPIGYLLTRREALAVLGATGLTLLASRLAGGEVSHRGKTPSGCVARPAQTEGPYFVDEALNRSDIRSDPKSGASRAGLPLLLGFSVSQIAANRCSPLVGALVDVWHCDALGVYSDVRDPSFDTQGEKWLRGYQVTDALGQAQFQTIFPGWYGGRTVHIHFKIRSPKGVSPAYEFTSQVYFDDGVTDTVHSQPPYASKGRRSTRNGGDRIFTRGGQQLTLALTPEAGGYKGIFEVSLQTG